MNWKLLLFFFFFFFIWELHMSPKLIASLSLFGVLQLLFSLSLGGMRLELGKGRRRRRRT